MRPPSSPSDRSGGLLAPLFGTATVDAEVSDTALLQAMLDAERALAWAGADAGVVPMGAADLIAAACDAKAYSVGELGRAADVTGNPVVPLVRRLGEQVPENARPWVHFGATSQDILDTALVLVVGRAIDVLLPLLDEASRACARMADAHRGTLMVARTLGQHAVPTTFGVKAAGWLAGLGHARVRLDGARADLAAQLGGAAGTLAVYGSAGPVVLERFAARLGLAEPVLPWHTERQRLLALASALTGVVTAGGKVALDVGLLAQTEVGEVSEGGAGTEGSRGGSSAMPHKRNPVDSVLVTAAARRAPGLLGTLAGSAGHEHERAAGAWHAEWEPLRELVRLAGSAAGRTHRMLEGLQVRPECMRANLEATGGLVMTESVAARLAPAVGRTAAHERVADLARAATADGTAVREQLLADDEVRRHLSVEEIDAALDPAGWLGSADALVDRALAEHRRIVGGAGR